MTVVDLFAGPGGWDLAATALGLDVLGIEYDDAACATREAAELRTLQADVAALDPHDFGPVDGLIASPPCQAWSMAGKGGGKRDKAHVMACLADLADGRDTRAEHGEGCEDARSMLVVEPLRWALALEPEWLAFEQVPPVLELWKVIGHALERHGWRVWCGILEAERYGVPQTRERAILLARRDRQPQPPVPTHQRYVPGEPRLAGPLMSLEGEVLPWVSMADALGWTEGALDWHHPRGPGMVERYGARRDVPDSEPAPAVTGKARSDEWRLRANSQPNAAVRDGEEPAPTITGGHDTGNRVWVMGINNDRPERKAAGAGNQPRPADKPAATVDSTTRQALWTHYDRRQQSDGTPVRTIPISDPAPTIACTGLAGRDVWTDSDTPTLGRGGANTVRVSVAEAAALQSFPPGYPWQGDPAKPNSRSKCFQMIGNAVPPLLALRTLEALLGREAMEPPWLGHAEQQHGQERERPGDPGPRLLEAVVNDGVDAAAE